VEGSGGDRVLLIFQAASCWFGIDPRFAQELAAPQVPRPVPRVPAYIPGLIPLRGRAVPLLDLEKFLGLTPADTARGQEDDLLKRIVVVTAGGMTVGILSDRVRSLVRVPARGLLPPESLPAGRVRDFAEAEIADSGGVMISDAGIIIVLKIGALLEAARLRPAGETA
jgi:purine-binding chemotaxis protein CheW